MSAEVQNPVWAFFWHIHSLRIERRIIQHQGKIAGRKDLRIRTVSATLIPSREMEGAFGGAEPAKG